MTIKPQNSLPAGISLWNDDCHRCDDCSRWAYEGDAIRHSTRCDTPTLQVSYAAEQTSGSKSLVVSALEGDARGHGFDDNDLVLGVRCGLISASTAMNQDM